MSEQILILAQAAVKLSEQYIPKVNHGASFMNAEALSALNAFEAAVSAYKREQENG